MKKYNLMVAVLFAVSLSACGGTTGTTSNDTTSAQSAETGKADGSEENGEEADLGDTSDAEDSNGTADEKNADAGSDTAGTAEATAPVTIEDAAGDYKTVSPFSQTTYVLHENGTYDITDPEAAGTYTVGSDGTVTLKQSATYASKTETFKPYGNYLYLSDWDCWTTDIKYGAELSFNDEGRTSQSFQTSYPSSSPYISYILNLSEDGTFSSDKEVAHQMGGGLLIDNDLSQKDWLTGTYELDGSLLMLHTDNGDYPLIYSNNTLYYTVIQKDADSSAE